MKQRYRILGFFMIALFIMGCQGKDDTEDNDDANRDGNDNGEYENNEETMDNDASANEGRVVLTVTDAAADMNGVSEIRLTIDMVEVQSNTEGWITLSDEEKTYDLLMLKQEGSNALVADMMVPEGSYNQLRLTIDEVIVIDEEGEHTAKLPSNKLMVQGNVDVEEDTTTTVTFDVIADESLHITGNGEYIMAPVIQLETRKDAQVTLENEDRVKIAGGIVQTNTKIGMDAEGNVGVGLNIPAQAKLSLSNGKVFVENKLGLGLGSNRGQGDNRSNNSGIGGGLNANLGSRYRY